MSTNIPPNIKPGDWINVDNIECVVKLVYPDNYPFGKCMVVFNKIKPTTRDVDWNGVNWIFPERPDYGGYGKDSDPFVIQLRRGRQN